MADAKQAAMVYGRKPRPPTKPNGRRQRGPRAAKAAEQAAPTAASMIAAIHSRADEDGDGFLNHREFGRIQKVLGHEAPNRQRWKQICAVLSCDARTGMSASSLVQLYELSGALPDADYNALYGTEERGVAGESAEYDPVMEAKAEHEANQRRPKQPRKPPRKARSKARAARSIKSTYGTRAAVEITTDADLYRTAGNLAFEVHKGSVEQGNMLRVLQDAAVASEQSGHAEKAKMIEQACAYVKQEAEAVKQAAFAAAYEKLHAKAVEKQKEEAIRIAQLEKERKEKLKREEDRVSARERQKILVQQEKEAKKAEKQSAARALKKNALLLEEQRKAKEDEARSARLVARSQRDRGRSKQLKKHDAERQEMLQERRKQRAMEKAQVEEERQKEKERLRAAQERNQIDLLERALEKAKLEALRRAEIEAMREAQQAIARMAKEGTFDPAPAVVEEIAEEEDPHTDSVPERQAKTRTVRFPEAGPVAAAEKLPDLAPINRVAVSTSDFPALEPLDDVDGGTLTNVLPEIGSKSTGQRTAQDTQLVETAGGASTETLVEDEREADSDKQPEVQEVEQVQTTKGVTNSAEQDTQQTSPPATPNSASEHTATSKVSDSQDGRLTTPWKRSKTSKPWEKKRTRNFAPDVLAAARVELDAAESSAASTTGSAQPGQTTGGFGMRRSSKKTPHERRVHHTEQIAAMVKQNLASRPVTQSS